MGRGFGSTPLAYVPVAPLGHSLACQCPACLKLGELLNSGSLSAARGAGAPRQLRVLSVSAAQQLLVLVVLTQRAAADKPEVAAAATRWAAAAAIADAAAACQRRDQRIAGGESTSGGENDRRASVRMAPQGHVICRERASRRERDGSVQSQPGAARTTVRACRVRKYNHPTLRIRMVAASSSCAHTRLALKAASAGQFG